MSDNPWGPPQSDEQPTQQPTRQPEGWRTPASGQQSWGPDDWIRPEATPQPTQQSEQQPTQQPTGSAPSAATWGQPGPAWGQPPAQPWGPPTSDPYARQAQQAWQAPVTGDPYADRYAEQQRRQAVGWVNGPAGTPTQPVVQTRPARRGVAFGQTPVTWAIIAACVVVWLLEISSPTCFDDIALTANQGRTEPWRFITSAFAHSTNVTHILFNMFALWTLRELELFFGRARFAAVYLLSALGGGVMFVALTPPSSIAWYGAQVVGASGAIFGLFGAMLSALRHVQASTRQLWLVIAVNMVLSFTFPNIAWQAHLGGFLVGGLAGWLLVRERRHATAGAPDRSWPWLGAMLAVVVVAGIARYALVG